MKKMILVRQRRTVVVCWLLLLVNLILFQHPQHEYYHHRSNHLVFFVSVHGYEFRHPTPKDIWTARMILLQEAMNPFSISIQNNNFIVAFDNATTTATTSTTRGEDQQQQQQQTHQPPMVGFGQIKQVDEKYSELASLYVYPQYRNKGIGGAIVETLLSNHRAEKNSKNTTKVCLLTLERTTRFYERHGFHQVTDGIERKRLPKQVQLEYVAGSVISSLLGNAIVCMVQKEERSLTDVY
jgi:N-acetylglutamate synthase-like GNAT family acetyltransferase